MKQAKVGATLKAQKAKDLKRSHNSEQMEGGILWV